MSEPEVALVFSADPWVEQLHRHLTDHGGARVRSLVVEASVALEEHYDVLVVSHRSPLLTRAFVADVRARGPRVLGVHDLDEPASRAHLAAVGVDAVIESDARPDAFVRALATLGARRAGDPDTSGAPVARTGRLVVVGGAPGVGRTEIAIELAIQLARRSQGALIDCDDVGPSVSQRLGLALEPNLRTAIDAVEHARGEVEHALLVEPHTRLPVVGGVANPAAWSQMRAGEVLRVVDRLADAYATVVADGAGSLHDGTALPRGRAAISQTIVREADVLVAVCDASPVGVSRLLGWVADARSLASAPPLVVVANRAPRGAFHRGELFDEITSSSDALDVVFAPADARVTEAAWDGAPVARGRFTRALERLTARVALLPRRRAPLELDVAS